MFNIVFRMSPRRTICFLLSETSTGVSTLVHQLIWLAQNRPGSINVTSCVANKGEGLSNVYFLKRSRGNKKYTLHVHCTLMPKQMPNMEAALNTVAAPKALRSLAPRE